MLTNEALQQQQDVGFLNALMEIIGRDVPMGAWGRLTRPQYFQICKKVGQKSAMLQDSWPQYVL